MARKKASVIKKVVTVLGILCALQIAVMYFLSRGRSEGVPIQQAIQQQVDKRKDLSPARREQLRVQLAVQDYQMSHNNQPPAALDELVPTYFNVVPVNPDTGKPFEYKVEGGMPQVIGSDVAVASAKSVGGKASTGAPGGELSEREKQLLVASLGKQEQGEPFVYDSSGRRDPFAPYNLAPRVEVEGRSPLEKYEIEKLKVTAVLEGADEPTAIVENEAGRGYVVKKGTKIGLNGGEVIEIQADRMLILETSADFTGQSRTHTIEMKLRTKPQVVE